MLAGDALKISAGTLNREVAESDRFTGEQAGPEEEKGAFGQERFDDGDEKIAIPQVQIPEKRQFLSRQSADVVQDDDGLGSFGQTHPGQQVSSDPVPSDSDHAAERRFRPEGGQEFLADLSRGFREIHEDKPSSLSAGFGNLPDHPRSADPVRPRHDDMTPSFESLRQFPNLLFAAHKTHFHMPDILQPELFFRSEYLPIQILAIAGL
jgi:hypothetical protein